MGNPNPRQNTNSHFKMLLFTDVVTKDELLTDAYDPKEVDGVVYEVDCAMITIKDGAQQVINAVHTFRLQSTSFDKKTYLTYLKGYMKAVKTYLQENKPDQVEAFEKGAQAFAKKIVGNFKDYEFYTGESMDPDGMVVLLTYREDGTTPYLIYWKHGLKEEKISA